MIEIDVNDECEPQVIAFLDKSYADELISGRWQGDWSGRMLILSEGASKRIFEKLALKHADD
jgi:hypothetical protein